MICVASDGYLRSDRGREWGRRNRLPTFRTNRSAASNREHNSLILNAIIRPFLIQIVSSRPIWISNIAQGASNLKYGIRLPFAYSGRKESVDGWTKFKLTAGGAHA